LQNERERELFSDVLILRLFVSLVNVNDPQSKKSVKARTKKKAANNVNDSQSKTGDKAQTKQKSKKSNGM
jgi:hypothetical protein